MSEKGPDKESWFRLTCSSDILKELWMQTNIWVTINNLRFADDIDLTEASSSSLQEAAQLLNEQGERSGLVMGDFNLPNSDWDLFAYPSNYLYSTAAEFICENGLTRVVSEPTRDEHILDIILRSDVLYCDDVCILPSVGNGDHNIVSIEISISLEAPIPQYSVTLRPNFSKANWIELNSFLALINWHAKSADCKIVSNYWNKFTLIVNDGLCWF